MDGSWESRVVSVAGIRSPVRIGGPESGEPVLFVHGNNAGADWGPLMTPVAEFARVIAPELPGFGSADKPAEWGYTVAHYATHLDGVLSQLETRPVHLVAHDFGGPFALAWAADHLDRTASITLINTPRRINHTAAKIWRTPILGELSALTANVPLTRALLKRSDPGLPDEHRDRIVEHVLVPGTERAVIELYRATGEHAIEVYVDRLAEFTGDVLIIWGDSDAYIAPEQADEQRQIFRNARVEVVVGVGHWPWLEQPDVVVGHLTNFLRR
ncbi:alpha/beta hydrolase [Mycolicibacterium moriokaense]|uniref:Alpha/beta hydrolase n=1 Tax=Mycolicibacterium moriokaense TaxID=39691 RepID=A0AAD1M5G1_9MYCO|nr:alpha/beta hydrolase [Mycolicibacterium moriokaense]MCV7041552.1 alpha/beta hydrolase [Mycolicibacterium moriokaense]ORB18413.1 alpha/beta hydrolase [Mycolicibacterium moriokaense]BBX00255.1 alpha/beta hydrolase [Mycolicibacterium moriokaense]